MSWLKNKWIQFYLWCHPNLKRVRLEVIAWSTEASVRPISIFHDSMLSRGKGLSSYLLPLLMKSKQHLFSNRWTRIDVSPPVLTLFFDYFDWTYLEKDIYPDNIYNDIVNRLNGDSLLMVIEIGDKDPAKLLNYLNNDTMLLHYPSMAMSAMHSLLIDLNISQSPTMLEQIFQTMYAHCFILTQRPAEFNKLSVFRHDGMLFILFGS